MNELRRDPVTRDWVVFATGRARRPREADAGEPVGSVGHEEDCPLCPGNEEQTPPEIERVPDGSSAGWALRVVPNRYPAFDAAAPAPDPSPGPLFERGQAVGAHELIVETPQHHVSEAERPAGALVPVFACYQRRYRALRLLTNVHTIVIFKNHRPEAGASLVHPHAQVVATPVAPPAVRDRHAAVRRHFERTGRGLYAELRDAERVAGLRVLFETASMVAVQPWAARVPFETWIMPLRDEPSIHHAGERELGDAASATQRVLRALARLLGDPPYNYVLHTSPVAEESQPGFLWHVQILPRLGNFAGFELGSGMAINTMLPEEAAAMLREAQV